MVSKYLLGCGLLVAFLFCFNTGTWAQELSREEKKALKKEIKQMTPEQFMEVRSNLQEQKEKISELEKDKSEAQKEMDKKAEELNDLQNRYQTLEEKYTKVMMEAAHEELHGLKPQEPGYDWDTGVVFRVQIGALTQEEYDKEIPSGNSMDVETKDSLRRMVIGYYRNYQEADTFKKLMRKIGIRTAWIVPYKDGQRVPLKEVMDKVVE